MDPSEDNELAEDGSVLGPVFMPDVERFDPGQLASQTDFIICLGGDGERKDARKDGRMRVASGGC